MVVGEGYRFGYRASGDTAALRELGAAAGLRVVVADLVDAGASGADGKVHLLHQYPLLCNSERRSMKLQCLCQMRICTEKGLQVINGRACRWQHFCTEMPLPWWRTALDDSDALIRASESNKLLGAQSVASHVGAFRPSHNACAQASSSRVREMLAAGDLEAVRDYLGRRYRLVAVAEPGAAEQRAPHMLWCAVAVDEPATELCCAFVPIWCSHVVRL